MAQKLVPYKINQAIKELISQGLEEEGSPYLIFDLDTALKKAMDFKKEASYYFKRCEIV